MIEFLSAFNLPDLKPIKPGYEKYEVLMFPQLDGLVNSIPENGAEKAVVEYIFRGAKKETVYEQVRNVGSANDEAVIREREAARIKRLRAQVRLSLDNFRSGDFEEIGLDLVIAFKTEKPEILSPEIQPASASETPEDQGYVKPEPVVAELPVTPQPPENVAPKSENEVNAAAKAPAAPKPEYKEPPKVAETDEQDAVGHNTPKSQSSASEDPPGLDSSEQQV